MKGGQRQGTLSQNQRQVLWISWNTGRVRPEYQGSAVRVASSTPWTAAWGLRATTKTGT